MYSASRICRQVARQAAHAVILALLAHGDRALVVAILLAPLGVEAPRLDRGARAGGDVHVAPRGRNAHRVDALELPRDRVTARPSASSYRKPERLPPRRVIHPCAHGLSDGKQEAVRPCRFPRWAARSPHRSLTPPMPYTNLAFDVRDRVATITINRPDKLNALDDATIAELGRRSMR